MGGKTSSLKSCTTESAVRNGNRLLGLCIYDRTGNFCANQILVFNNTLFHTVVG